MPELMPFVPALISGGGALAGLFGGGPPAPPPVWRPPGMNAAANQTTGLISQNLSNNVPAQLMPQYQQIVQMLTNNPNAGGAMTGANNASGYAGNAAALAGGGGDLLAQFAAALGNQAFDPQNALYGRTLHNVTEQTRAGNEARGIDMTPFGAGVENKALSDFNIDWQNNLLQRMIQGGGAAGNLMNTGVNLAGQAPGLAFQSGMYPYSTFNQLGTDKLSFLDALAKAGINSQTIPNTSIQQLLSYIGQGNQANSVANQGTAIGGQLQNLGFQQNQILGGQLGQSVNAFNNAGGVGGFGRAIGNLYNGGGSTGWGGGGGVPMPQANPWASGGYA